MLKNGLISMEDIDSAVKNVLRLKFRLGLFENPYTEIISSNRYLKKEYREIAEQLAIESAVLLKNDDILPLEKPSKIYISGNLLADNEALLGSWLAHGNTNDVVSLESGFKRFIPYRSKLVDDPHKADFIILCLGENKEDEWRKWFTFNTSIHNAHKVEEFYKYKKPLILVVGSGRPISTKPFEPKVNAIVHIWQPGVEAGNALAKLIFGLENFQEN